MSIAIVTDSTADIPEELAQKNQIHVVPNLVIIKGQSLEDGVSISRKEFYQRLPDMTSPPTTATASSGVYQQLYAKLIQQGATKIFSIHASSLLSGIMNAANIAAQAFSGKVSVIDSEQVSLGLGFQVLAAAEAVLRGASFEAVQKLISDVRKRVHLIAMLDTLEYVRRSGRVSWARARLGNLLNIKPFVEVAGGHVLNRGEARTRHKGIERLKDFLRSLGALERLAILHTNAEAEATQFLKDINLELPTNPLVINVTTVIGTHAGPNALGFAAIVK